MAGRVTKVIRLKINGTPIQLTGDGATFDPGGAVREPVPVDGVDDGDYTEVIQGGVVSGSALHRSDTNLSLLNGKNLTLMILTDSGARYMIRKAYATKPSVVSGSNAAFELRGPVAKTL